MPIQLLGAGSGQELPQVQPSSFIALSQERREKRLQAELAQWVAKDLWDRAASQAHA